MRKCIWSEQRKGILTGELQLVIATPTWEQIDVWSVSVGDPTAREPLSSNDDDIIISEA